MCLLCIQCTIDWVRDRKHGRNTKNREKKIRKAEKKVPGFHENPKPKLLLEPAKANDKLFAYVTHANVIVLWLNSVSVYGDINQMQLKSGERANEREQERARID